MQNLSHTHDLLSEYTATQIEQALDRLNRYLATVRGGARAGRGREVGWIKLKRAKKS
jgi:hypothetical protein